MCYSFAIIFCKRFYTSETFKAFLTSSNKINDFKLFFRFSFICSYTNAINTSKILDFNNDLEDSGRHKYINFMKFPTIYLFNKIYC